MRLRRRLHRARRIAAARFVSAIEEEEGGQFRDGIRVGDISLFLEEMRPRMWEMRLRSYTGGRPSRVEVFLNQEAVSGAPREISPRVAVG